MMGTNSDAESIFYLMNYQMWRKGFASWNRCTNNNEMPMNNILSDSPSLTNWTFSPVAATTATSSNITMLVAPKLNV